VVTKRSEGALPAMSDPVVRRRYGIIVGLEFGLLGAGAAVLGATGHYRWIAVLIGSRGSSLGVTGVASG
jgi:hypothetical protein